MANIGSSPRFQDFDDLSVYQRYEDAILKADTCNMVIEFDNAKAQAALDVSNFEMKRILDSKPVKNATTRWINIWGPERQKDVMKAIASHYGFSPRLLLLMLTDHDKRMPAVVSTHQDDVRAIVDSSSPKGFTSVESHSGDIEGHHELTEFESQSGELDLNYYRLVDEVWHFCSVDWGSRYLCTGYNSLCNPQRENSGTPELEKPPLRDKPLGVRYWSWLILCNDGTIVSIQENPFPNHRGALSSKQKTILYLMRRNLLNIFQQLSKAKDQRSRENHIMTIPVRPGLQDVTSNEISPSDAPSLLFHYLFDDWLTSYSLVARKEHQYSMQLEVLREKLFLKPDVNLIDDLHHIGRQLAVLKRMYQSYALIIERILERQKPVRTPIARKPSQLSDHTAQVVHDVSLAREELSADAQNFGEPLSTQTYGVSLSSAATVRFERLRDRINLYALSEIQECLDEKESLVFLNFNLITLKESQAVERLTRITILLAKVTILFMPVSLMTSYFSVQVKGLEDAYNATTYWACFGIIMGLSLIFLIIFGKVSGTLEGSPIYRSMTTAFLDFSKAAIGSKRRKKSR